jgi:hypothetical protein
LIFDPGFIVLVAEDICVEELEREKVYHQALRDMEEEREVVVAMLSVRFLEWE